MQKENSFFFSFSNESAFDARHLLLLFMMVGFTTDDGAGTVDLFGEGEADHLVREGHLRQGQLFVGTCIDGRGETVGTTDDENQPAGCLLFLF